MFHDVRKFTVEVLPE